MNVLVIGTVGFQRWAQEINHNQAWDVAVAHSYDEVEDLTLVSAFQAVLIDLDDAKILSSELFALVSKLQRPFVTIGFSEKEPSMRYRNLFSGMIDVCFRKQTLAELLKMQCNAVIRLAQGHKSPAIHIASVSLNVDTKCVAVLGTTVGLNNREYQLLELLFTNPNRVITVERFFNQVYGFKEPPEAKILNVLICNIRRKLRTAGLLADLIQTRRGQGYVVSQVASTTLLKAA